MQGVRDSADLDDDAEASLRSAIQDFKTNVFAAGDGAAG